MASCCNSLNRKRPRTIRCGCRLLTNPTRTGTRLPASRIGSRRAARLRPTATEAVWLHVTRGDTVTRDAPITAAAINNVVQRRVSAAGLENVYLTPLSFAPQD